MTDAFDSQSDNKFDFASLARLAYDNPHEHGWQYLDVISEVGWMSYFEGNIDVSKNLADELNKVGNGMMKIDERRASAYIVDSLLLLGTLEAPNNPKQAIQLQRNGLELLARYTRVKIPGVENTYSRLVKRAQSLQASGRDDEAFENVRNAANLLLSLFRNEISKTSDQAVLLGVLLVLQFNVTDKAYDDAESLFNEFSLLRRAAESDEVGQAMLAEVGPHLHLTALACAHAGAIELSMRLIGEATEIYRDVPPPLQPSADLVPQRARSLKESFVTHHDAVIAIADGVNQLRRLANKDDAYAPMLREWLSHLASLTEKTKSNNSLIDRMVAKFEKVDWKREAKALKEEIARLTPRR